MPKPTPPGYGVPPERPRRTAWSASWNNRPGRRAAMPPRRFPKVLCSRLTFRPLIARNLAVEQVNLAVRVYRNVVFVRHQHDGLARIMKLVKQPHDLIARRGVEVAHWLVGEQDARRVHQGARDGDALALSAGQLVGPVIHTVTQSHLLKRAGGALAPLFGSHAGVNERQPDVVERIAALQPMEPR